MNTKLNDGGPAFPIPGKTYSYAEGSFQDPEHGGMSLRDYFATHANDSDLYSIPTGRVVGEGEDGRYVEYTRQERRYIYADAMLAAREVQP